MQSFQLNRSTLASRTGVRLQQAPQCKPVIRPVVARASLFEKLGGRDAVVAAVDIFYQKVTKYSLAFSKPVMDASFVCKREGHASTQCCAAVACTAQHVQISQLTCLHVELNPIHHFCLQVLADDRVNSYFQSTDMVKQKAHQVGSFLPNCGPSVQWLQYMMPGNMQAAIV